MTKAELNKFKQILEGKKGVLTASTTTVKAVAEETSTGSCSEAMEAIQTAEELRLAFGNLARNSNLLRQVEDALARIDDGSYGTCLECKRIIAPNRVIALPWAPLCLDCQAEAEIESQRGNLDDLKLVAATA